MIFLMSRYYQAIDLLVNFTEWSKHIQAYVSNFEVESGVSQWHKDWQVSTCILEAQTTDVIIGHA